MITTDTHKPQVILHTYIVFDHEPPRHSDLYPAFEITDQEKHPFVPSGMEKITSPFNIMLSTLINYIGYCICMGKYCIGRVPCAELLNFPHIHAISFLLYMFTGFLISYI